MSECEEYTPTMDEIKLWYAGAVDEYRCDTGMSMDEAESAFDRAIAAHDRELRERIAREIEALMVGPAVSITDPIPWDWKRAGMLDMQKLAARIARGEGSE